MPRNDERDGLEHTGYRSGQIRIIGAEPAGPAAAMRAEEDPRDHWDGEGDIREPEEEDSTTGIVTPPLPHWTEPATGEVPAIFSRGGAPTESDPFASLPGPTWREEGSDWEAQDEEFEPSMLAGDQTGQGSLDTTTDRQPWVFDLPGSGDEEGEIFGEEPEWGQAEADWDDLSLRRPSAGWNEEDDAPITEVIPVVGSAEPNEREHGEDSGRPSVTRAGITRPTDEPDEEEEEEPFFPEEPAAHDPLVIDDQDAALDEPHSRFRSLRPGQRRAQAAPKPSAPRRPTAARRPAPGGARQPAGREHMEAPPRNVTAAIISGLVIGGLALVTFKVGPAAAICFVTLIVTMAAAEAYAAFRQGGYHPVTLLGLVATVSVMVATYNRGLAALPLVFVLLLAACFVWHLSGVEHTDAVRSIGTTLFVFGWVAVFGSFAALLLSPNLFPHRHGIAFLLGAAVAGVSYDVGALTFGAWLGRHPLSSVSPNKTWEGFFGGLITSLLLSVVIVHMIHPWTVGKAAALALVVSVVATLGDLFESTVKRHLGRKDMGRLLPGHGGLLDRVDGLLFALPATYYLVIAFHLG